MTCPACGAAAAEGARFCASCGQPLLRRADERRVVTVLFADIVGFTTMSETRDPEQVKNLVDTCFERLVADIDAYGGLVDKIVGDAIVALFGAPTAHEDDAERAVRAGLQLQRTVAQWSESQAAPLRLRVGINTGEVLVGALRAGGDYTAMGDVVNTASRLQTNAHPGQVLVGASTYWATRGVVRYTPVGPIVAKGREEPVDAWTAEEALLPPGARPNRGQAPLVGRDPEVGLLSHAVHAAVARRRAHLLLLVGEAGLGKTRIAEAVADAAACTHEALVLEGRCVPYGEANVWWPVAEALRSGLGVAANDPFEEALERCTSSVRVQLGDSTTEAEVERVTSGLLRLLGYENSLARIDPTRAREEVARSLFAFVEASARNRPLVVVLSDLHWADEIVLTRMDELLERVSGLPFVLVGTARQSLLERWEPRAGRHNVVVFNLDPLDRAAAAELLAALAEGELPADLRDVVLDRSGGNPFYLEELVSLVGEAGMVGGRPVGERGVELPDTLRGLVAARLDGLSPDERLVLDDAAVMGRRGTVEALEIMAREAHDRPDIKEAVAGLVAKDVLEVADRRWSFRSDLMREVAYGMLTKADRARRHGGIAKWMELHDNEREASVDRIAHHYALAAALATEVGADNVMPWDLTERALVWLERALDQAEGGELYPVAVQLCSQALDFGDALSPAERMRFLLARAHSRIQLRDLDNAREDLSDAMTVAVAADDRPGRAKTLLERGDLEQKAADFEASMVTLGEAVDAFRALGDDLGTAEALRARGLTLMFADCNDEAEAAFSDALDLYRAAEDQRGEAWALQNLAWLAFSRGRADQADAWLHKSATTFSAIKDAGGLGWALGLLAWVRFHQGRYDEAEQLGEQILGDARTRGDQWAVGMMLVLLSALRLWSGRTDGAVEAASEAVDLFRTMGDFYGRTQSLGALARALAATGRPEEAFDVLAESDQRIATGQVTTDGAATMGDLFAVLLAAQTGLAERVGATIVDPSSISGDAEAVGFEDLHVAFGLLHLQRGDVSSALPFLERAVDGHDRNPFGLAGLALATAAAGQPERAIEFANEALLSPKATYADRVTAFCAQAFAHAQNGSSAEAVAATEEARLLADGTRDVMSQALVRLADAEVLGALDDPGADAAAAEADERLRSAGIGDTAWRRAFRLALVPERRAFPAA